MNNFTGIQKELPKISIIIPVYNVEKYLRGCLDSVVSQSLADIEIICVDDGSTDSSPIILEEYAQKDKRVSVFSQKNMHAGVARNLGMKHARGKYLYFMDSDDWLEENALVKMYENAEKEQAEILEFAFYNVTDEKKNPCKWYLNCWSQQPNNLPMEKCYNLGPQVWTKLFLRSFVERNGLQFEEWPAGNDYYFVYCSVTLASSISLSNDMLYNYRINAKGAISRTRGKHIACMVKAMAHIKEELKNRHIWDVNKSAFYRLFAKHMDYEMKQCSKWRYKLKFYAALDFEDLQRLYPALLSKVEYKAGRRIISYFGGVIRKVKSDRSSKYYLFGVQLWHRKKR
jgi:glycosyltransferase involved in cell wall biosynthesis